MQPSEHDFLAQAIELAYQNVERGGRPFGALLVKDNQVIATGVNEMIQRNDPTAHAELLAIRAAGQQLGTADLKGCHMFASGQPCPMCMAAMYLAGIQSFSYAYSNQDGAAYGLSTAELSSHLSKPITEQSINASYIPVRSENKPDLYAYWKAVT